ncbi:PepSY-associated TM helix domain-containing protein [Leptospira limi]|uniref:PepSY domain-containing protein n=1 Tax=Leptospira limi TaxID=2950023 RepID=A0ABT3M124_9LEPT|nr:PepSY-associated TM helix domain-containing protein [Leptospira limi]MCW7463666.1 PepSY domain-containing protein [Leptospira limi]
MKAKRFYQLHLVLGMIGSSFLLVIGITGSLLVYGKEIQSLFTPIQIPLQVHRLSFDGLYQQLVPQLPEGSISGWLVSDLLDQPDQIWFHDTNIPSKEVVYLLDPYNGKIVGALKEDRSDSFYGFVLVLHYSLFLGKLGYFIVGCIAIVYFLLVITGIKLYKRFWFSLFRFRWKESFQILFSDLHKFVGINFIWFHFILAVTGAWWSIRDTFIRSEPKEIIIHQLWSHRNSIDELITESKRQIPNFHLGYISFPHHNLNEPIGFYGNRYDSSGWESRYGSYLQFDRRTKKINRIVDITKESYLNQILDSFRPFHFGTFANHYSKILWTLGGLTPAILSLSGLVIFYRKRVNRKKIIK